MSEPTEIKEEVLIDENISVTVNVKSEGVDTTMMTLQEWRQKQVEMAGGGFIVGAPTAKDCNNPDFQVAGAACGVPDTKPAVPKKKRVRKKKSS